MKRSPKYEYCIHGSDSRTGLCGKENPLRWMYACYADAKSGLQPPCKKCLEAGNPKKRRKKAKNAKVEP